MVWADLGSCFAEDDMYLSRVHWLPNGSLAVEVESRDQTRLALLRIDVATGAGEVGNCRPSLAQGACECTARKSPPG